MKNAKPSSENGRPMIPPANGMKPREQQTQLEADDGPRHGADREQDRERLGPPARERAPHGVAGAQVHALGDQHHQRQPDSEHGKAEVKRQGGAHLGAACDQVAHVCTHDVCLTAASSCVECLLHIIVLNNVVDEQPPACDRRRGRRGRRRTGASGSCSAVGESCAPAGAHGAPRERGGDPSKDRYQCQHQNARLRAGDGEVEAGLDRGTRACAPNERDEQGQRHQPGAEKQARCVASPPAARATRRPGAMR